MAKDKARADTLMQLCAENWPELHGPTQQFIVYLNRVGQLGINEAAQVMRVQGLSLGEFDVLASLRRTAPPHRLSPTQLHCATLITSGGLTKLLYQLEARGLVERQVHAGDKRSKLVLLTTAGKALVESTMAQVIACDQRWLNAALDENELAQLNQLLGKVLAVLEHD
ncbi:MarR family winged helix-turn-helix transcriptional regulator [Rhabdochromatium marinum]|uniref:MarR family winged helix-turn-helix transcriptional regulator n=1 Tax=Rhabdochromatium marinum TaxID=48729 RepID=UPI001907301A|nr:MarR family transcriptional regulator [Rhabdochromatium marinum]MBK1649020.1 hypothetical protein [Rhabdochromatium marinum]